MGFLPGEIGEKVDPYMRPFLDTAESLLGDPLQIEKIKNCVEIAPLAFMRGRTFKNAICILDEAQNATTKQLKLFLTRFGEDSKIIITGDPKQSDLKLDYVPLSEVIRRLDTVPGIAIFQFSDKFIQRHPLVAAIIKKLEEI